MLEGAKRGCWLLVLSLLAVAAAGEEPVCTTADEPSCQDDETGNNQWAFLDSFSEEDALVHWLQSMDGGSVATDKFRIERSDYSDDSLNPNFDFFATKDIEKGDILMEIPQSAILGNFVTPVQEKLLKAFLDVKGKDSIDAENKPFVPMCMAIDAIVNEQEKGTDSPFYPYLKFVFGNGNPIGKLPGQWGDDGEFLFWGMLGPANTIYIPDERNHYIEHSATCEEYKLLTKPKAANPEALADVTEWEDHRKDMETMAYTYFSKHSWGTSLIPLFDLIPHRNGKSKNVEARFVDAETGAPVAVKPRDERFNGFVRSAGDDQKRETKLVVYAHRNISEGEPLRVSYNQCEHLGCEKLKLKYTSNHLLADMGIVEEYPRRWVIAIDPYENAVPENRHIVFDVDIDPSSGERTFRLIKEVGAKEEIYRISVLGRSVDRWNNLYSELEEHTVPGEWTNNTARDEHVYKFLWEFLNAYTEGFEMAWLHRYDAPVEDSDEIGPVQESSQNQIDGHYDDLAGPHGHAVTSRGRWTSCAEGEVSDGGKMMTRVNGFYQSLEYWYEEDLENTFMRMSTWLHSGSNFRAHYHESVIHVALQYVKEPKRVAYIGGGDNMVLAELLKYPTIEKIVGMELDQQACRSSMKYFGTSPTYHEDRVEWWYGNGAISLQLLPEEYLGSFDLVLVDLLTEVAEAIQVAAELTLLDAAPLLMKPNGGILARNEDIVDRSQGTIRMAKRVVMYDYYDCPRTCDVSMSFGSNSVDFFNAPRYDHGIETVVRLKNFENDTYTGWSQYFDASVTDGEEKSSNNVWNSTTDQRVCDKLKAALPAYREQPTSGGFLLVIEAENVSVSMEPDDLPDLHDKISSVAAQNGLTPFGISYDPKIDAHLYLLVCKEGYIKMVTFPKENYVAFDLVLWGGNTVTDKSKAIENDLVAVVGGGRSEDSVSTFKVATGGMAANEVDAASGKGDNNGLVEKAVEYYCGTESSGSDDPNKATENEKPYVEKEDEQVFDGSSVLIEEIAWNVTTPEEQSPPTFAIFCGKKADQDCSIYSSVSSSKSDGETSAAFHPVYSCESFEDMEGCEQEITQRLFGVVSEHKRLDGFVLDRSVPLDMGKVLHKVFNNTLHQPKILERSFVGIAPGGEGSWRNILLDRFRTEMIIFPPLEKADFELSNETHSEQWSLVSVRNNRFMWSFHGVLESVSKKTGWAIATKKILGTVKPLITDWDPPNPKDDDFFDEKVFDQWFTQKPLANQYLLQMEVGYHPAPLEVNEKVLVGKEFRQDGVFTDPRGFLQEYYEATVVEIKDRDKIVVETTPYLLNNGTTLNFEIRHANNKTKTVMRHQIRKLSPTEHERRYDIGDHVLVQMIDDKSKEAIPTGWYAGVVLSVDDEGLVSIRHKESWNTYPDQDDLSPDKVMVYSESPEFSVRDSDLSFEALEVAFEEALDAAHLTQGGGTLQNFRIGKGYIVSYLSPHAIGVMKWDGASRVEVNMLAHKEPSMYDFDVEVRPFSMAFLQKLPNLRLIAKDSFPRGTGRVVNFEHEMVVQDPKDAAVYEEFIPHWMNNHVDEELRETDFEVYYRGFKTVETTEESRIVT